MLDLGSIYTPLYNDYSNQYLGSYRGSQLAMSLLFFFFFFFFPPRIGSFVIPLSPETVIVKFVVSSYLGMRIV